MPLLLHKHIENGEIGLWKISEDPEELLILADLSPADQITYSEISGLHRKKEWLATRALLKEIRSFSGTINYHEDGRPYLKGDECNISISHTKGYAAVFLHERYTPGIDIELTSRHVGKVASRFLSPEEFEMCHAKPELSEKRLLLLWCAKEAIFKMVPYSNIEFSTDIKITISETLLSKSMPKKIDIDGGSPDGMGQAMWPLKNNLLSHETPNDFSIFKGVFMGSAEPITVDLEYLDDNDVILVWGCTKPLRDT